MSQVPERVLLFHITAIANLPAILAEGAIVAKNMLAARGGGHVNIAHVQIQNRRAAKQVALPPGGTLHDYVPFYFAPRSPMLMALHRGNVADCNLEQSDIVYLVSSPQNVVRNDLPFVFYDLHAALGYSTCYNDLSRLDMIDWPLITEPPHVEGAPGYCKFFQDVQGHERYSSRMEVRQAEFLVHERVPLGTLLGFATIDEQKQREVERILSEAGQDNLKVRVRSGWYF